MIQAIPLFQEAHLLRRTMLEALSDYAYLANQYKYLGYADGILSGCGLKTTQDTIIVEEGLVLYEGQVFLLKEPMSVNYHPTNRTTVLKLCFSDEMRDANFIYREAELQLAAETTCRKGELELCRFKLQEGARLRCQYQDFEDRSTEFDTLNRVYVPYAAMGGSTLAREITENFAKEMLAVEEISELDVLFCMQILGQSEPVGREALRVYLERRNKRELADASNHGIYQGLVKVLREAKGLEEPEKVQGKKKWTLMVE